MPLEASDLTYRDMPEQQKLIVRAFKYMSDEKEKDRSTYPSYNAMMAIVQNWWKEMAPEGFYGDWENFKRNTVEKLWGGGLPQKFENRRIIYAFLQFHEEDRFRLIARGGLGGVIETERARYLNSYASHFADGAAFSYETMGNMKGLYQGYRPSWREGGEDYVILSKVEIFQGDNGFWLNEEQDFYSVAEKEKVYETDEGPLAMTGTAVTCLARSLIPACQKFYSFHERDKDLMAVCEQDNDWRKKRVSVIKGHVMAVSNRGPHWSSPIYLRRMPEEKIRQVCLPIWELDEMAHVSDVSTSKGEPACGEDEPPEIESAALAYLRENQVPKKLLPPMAFKKNGRSGRR